MWCRLKARIPLLCALLAVAGWAAAAGSALDRQLARSLGSASASAAGASGKKVHDSAAGQWTLLDDAQALGLSCTVTFQAKSARDVSLSFMGPTAESSAGVIVFVSPQIPKPGGAAQVTVRLQTARDAPQDVKATHLQSANGPAVLAVATDMKTTVSALDDVDSVHLKMGSNTVFQLNYQGGHAARDALLQCMANGQAGR